MEARPRRFILYRNTISRASGDPTSRRPNPLPLPHSDREPFTRWRIHSRFRSSSILRLTVVQNKYRIEKRR